MLIIPTKEQIVSTCYIQVLSNNVICSKFSIQEAKINKINFRRQNTKGIWKYGELRQISLSHLSLWLKWTKSGATSATIVYLGQTQCVIEKNIVYDSCSVIIFFRFCIFFLVVFSIFDFLFCFGFLFQSIQYCNILDLFIKK